jgi:hypothetical protein
VAIFHDDPADREPGSSYQGDRESLADGAGAICDRDGDHASRAWWPSRIHLLGDAALEPMFREPAEHGAGGRSDRGRGQQQRGPATRFPR